MEMVGRASLSHWRFLVLTLSLGVILVMYVLGTVGVSGAVREQKGLSQEGHGGGESSWVDYGREGMSLGYSWLRGSWLL